MSAQFCQSRWRGIRVGRLYFGWTWLNRGTWEWFFHKYLISGSVLMVSAWRLGLCIETGD